MSDANKEIIGPGDSAQEEQASTAVPTNQTGSQQNKGKPNKEQQGFEDNRTDNNKDEQRHQTLPSETPKVSNTMVIDANNPERHGTYRTSINCIRSSIRSGGVVTLVILCQTTAMVTELTHPHQQSQLFDDKRVCTNVQHGNRMLTFILSILS